MKEKIEKTRKAGGDTAALEAELRRFGEIIAQISAAPKPPK